MEQQENILPWVSPSANFVYSVAEVSTNRKNNLDLTPQCSRPQQALDEFGEEYKDTFSLHKGDTGQTKLLTIDIHTRDYPPITAVT